MSGDSGINTDDNNNNSKNNSNNNRPVGRTGSGNTGSDGNDDEGKYSDYKDNHRQQTPECWVLVLAIAILAMGVLLLTLRSVGFSVILVTIGVSLFAYWLYVGVRSREQNPSLSVYRSSSNSNGRISPSDKLGEGGRGAGGDRICSCAICKHMQSGECLKLRCPCCVLMRSKKIIGHF